MRHLAALLGLFALLAASPALAAANALSVEANAAFLAANARKAGVIVRPSGLQYRIIHNGFGKRPGPLDTVTVYYTGSLINGTVFDGTEPGLPAQLKLSDVIPGWTEALTLMREGDQWQIVIPANLAYGARGAGAGAIPPNQALVFDLTLVTVTPYKEPPHKDDESSPGNGAN
ncbi:MAG: FKBP-type peptidyl-prolyl cis-trans isomerase [Alphaproteobacteria bacterium]|nr:FKBP-type peptidyl-prolyl cis-trans isomerase [Alphaproteobacteria bacterium]MBV9694606.1 FKBP-type peptidyl-prolyl cis-trans isomerase [Alphaproteobacteria bacterium]